jgi:hypothetical protein
VVQDGFAFIINEGPRSAVNLQQLIWTTIQIKDEASPVYTWPPKLVEKALHQMSAQGSLATTYTAWFLTMADFDQSIVDVAVDLHASRNLKSTWWLGVPGVGKTPFAKTLATSGLATRQYRTSSELDFFRGEQGDVLRPDIFDDGDSSAQNTKSMKAFSDVSLQEAAVWARWGGCRWPKGCFRQALDNKVDLTKEIDDHSLSITHENFMGLVSPAFHKDANQSDREAILKKANFVVCANKWLYVRLATENHVMVRRKAIGAKKDWLLESK